MDKITYIHAADLHLDTPFIGLGRNFAAWAARLRNAAFIALDNLAQLCLAKKPDFLVLAGDIYNQEECSIKAQLKLRDMCVELEKAQIPVFIVHGNHDPLSSRFAAVQWPGNTRIFGAEPQAFPVGTIALVHGISHASDKESRNLAKLFARDENNDCFQLGLLHCNVDGAVAGDRYAPCSLADLLNSGLDAWALGHAHNRRVLNDRPFIAYSGNIQGLRAGESGSRGCYVVTAGKVADGWQCNAEFHELGPLQWQTVEVNVENAASLDEVETRIGEAIQKAGHAGSHALILDIALCGRTILAPALAAEETLEELGNRLQPWSADGVDILLRKLENASQPLVSEAENLERDDILGEVFRVAKKMETNPEELAAVAREAFAPLARACRGILQPAENDDLIRILNAASRICQDRLETR